MSSWEQFMADAAANRARVAAEAEPVGCQIGDPMPAGHAGHHWHERGWGVQCSCGGLVGLAAYVLPDGWTPEKQAEWDDANRCPVCGEPGVLEPADG